MNGVWKSKKMIALLIVVIIGTAVLGVCAFKYNSTENKPFNTTEKTFDLKVQQGESLNTVLDELKSKNLLSSPFFTKIYLKLHSSSENIKPGNYQVESNMDLKSFIDMLVKGSVASYKVTFPEGYTIEQMADTLAKDGIVQKDVFLDAVKNYPLPSYITPNPERRYNLEGFLYPDTYYIPKTATANDIISMMLNKFQEVMKQAEKATGVNVPEQDYQKYITIASMIEEEANTQEDRYLVSSVIYNRLAKGMPLQLDATVLYAMGHHQDKVYFKNLKVDSPYNTYVVKGLPVGAISNPGIESIEAALKPAKTDYLYYILGEGNKHYFTNNYEDFLKAKKDLGYN